MLNSHQRFFRTFHAMTHGVKYELTSDAFAELAESIRARPGLPWAHGVKPFTFHAEHKQVQGEWLTIDYGANNIEGKNGASKCEIHMRSDDPFACIIFAIANDASGLRHAWRSRATTFGCAIATAMIDNRIQVAGK